MSKTRSTPKRLNTKFSLDQRTKRIKRSTDLEDFKNNIIALKKSLLPRAIADRRFYSLEDKNHDEQLVYALVKHQPTNDALDVYTFSFLEESNQPKKDDYKVRLADLTPALQVRTATQDELKAIHERIEKNARLGNIEQQNALSILKKEIHGDLKCIVNSEGTLPYEFYDLTMFVSKNSKLLNLFKALDREQLELLKAWGKAKLLNKAHAATPAYNFYLLQKKKITFKKWLAISKKLIAAAPKTPKLPLQDEKTIPPNLNDAVILKCVIDTADFSAEIWKNPLCSAYALYLLQRGQITFKQWRTVSMILIAKAQLTTDQPLQDKYAKTRRPNYGVTIKRLVEKGQFTPVGKECANLICEGAKKLGCEISLDEIKE